MKLSRVLMLSAFIAAQVTVAALRAEDTNTVEVIKQLQKRIEELEQKVNTLERGKETTEAGKDAQAKQRAEELDQKVRILQRERELDEEAAQVKAKQAPKITIGEQGFSFVSANTNFALQLKGLLQIDSRTFLEDGGIVGNDTLLIRRMRPSLQGTVFRDFDFVIIPDFAGSTPQLFDAYVNYRYTPAWQLQVGKFKVPVGLELLQSDRDAFFNERALPSGLVPSRDLGAELHGDFLEGVVSYVAGVFNGVGDARVSSNADFEDDKEFVGRVFFQPFKKTSVSVLQGFGFGLGSSFESMQGTNTTGLPATTGGTLPGYFSVGQQQFFAYSPAVAGTNRPVVVADGEHWRLSPQGYYFYGPFGLLGEYVISDQRVSRVGAGPFASRRLANTAWQIAVCWVLTGEDAAYAGGVLPRRPFNPAQGDWGAWQLVARYTELEIDPEAFPLFSDPLTSARSAQGWSVGLNWWLNRSIRVNGSFSRTTFDGGGEGTSAPASVTRKDENVLFTRVQLSF